MLLRVYRLDVVLPLHLDPVTRKELRVEVIPGCVVREVAPRSDVLTEGKQALAPLPGDAEG